MKFEIEIYKQLVHQVKSLGFKEDTVDNLIEIYKREAEDGINKKLMELISNKNRRNTVEAMEKSHKFVKHVEAHLKEGEVVICKICNKTIDEINSEGS